MPNFWFSHSQAQIMRGSRVGTGGPPPFLENTDVGFLINTGPDPMENHKATFQFWATIGPPAKRWWADDGPLLVVFRSSPLKTLSDLDPSDITFWVRACKLYFIFLEQQC